MDRRRQAVFLFVAGAVFGLVCVERAARHGIGPKVLIAGVLAAILAALGAKAQRDAIARPRDDRE